jgi:hypothetical protein
MNGLEEVNIIAFSVLRFLRWIILDILSVVMMDHD